MPYPPQIPYLSNLTGTWITPEAVIQTDYWVQHLCQPVRFAQQVRELWQQQQPIMLEIGAGQTLSSLALQCLESVPATEKIALPSLRHNFEGQSDNAFILNTLAQLWLAGVEIDWFAFSQGDRQRLPLPTYPFEDQRYWIDPPSVTQANQQINQQSAHLWQSLVNTAQAIGQENLTETIAINLISQNLQQVVGTETLNPRQALVMGAVKVIPTEYPQLPCRSIDIQLSDNNSSTVQQLIAEADYPIVKSTVAYRGQYRWVQEFEPVKIPATTATPAILRHQGVYLITGGLGRIGLVMAKYLAQTVKAKLVLVGRSEFPPESAWTTWLEQHDAADPISSKIEQLQEIQQLGGEILIAPGDVSDRQSLENISCCYPEVKRSPPTFSLN